MVIVIIYNQYGQELFDGSLDEIVMWCGTLNFSCIIKCNPY